MNRKRFAPGQIVANPKQAAVGILIAELIRQVAVPTLRSLDEKARTIDFVTSTETADRYGDVIRVAGSGLRFNKKNPVFVWEHRSQNPPIGKRVRIWTEQNPPALCQTIQFGESRSSTTTPAWNINAFTGVTFLCCC